MAEPQSALVPAFEIDRSTVAVLCARSAEVAIFSEGDYHAAGELARELAARRIALSDQRMTITRQMDAAKAQVMALFEPVLRQIDQANGLVRSVILEWTQEQERIRREQAQHAQAAAEAERQQLEALALQAAEAGNVVGFEVLAEAAAEVQAPKVARTYQRAAGTSTSLRWSAEVTFLRDLVKAVVEGRAPLETIEPNMTVLNGMARSLKAGLQIPGVRAVGKPTLNVSGR